MLYNHAPASCGFPSASFPSSQPASPQVLQLSVVYAVTVHMPTMLWYTDQLTTLSSAPRSLTYLFSTLPWHSLQDRNVTVSPFLDSCYEPGGGGAYPESQHSGGRSRWILWVLGQTGLHREKLKTVTVPQTDTRFHNRKLNVLPSTLSQSLFHSNHNQTHFQATKWSFHPAIYSLPLPQASVSHLKQTSNIFSITT